MRFRFIPNEILAARSFGGVSNSRDPFHSGVRQQTALASARRAVVNGRGICAAHRDADRRLGARRALSVIRSARDVVVSGVGTRRWVRHRALSISGTSSRRVYDAADLRPDFRGVIDHGRFRHIGRGLLDDLVVSDSHDAAGLRLRGILYRLHGQRHVLAPGTGAQAQNVQRLLSSSAVALDDQRNRNARGSNWSNTTYAGARRGHVLELVVTRNYVAERSERDLRSAYVAALLRARNLSFHRKLARTSSSVARRSRVRARALHFSGRAIARQLSRVRSGIDLTLMRSLNQCR